jgi:hypothetical protein
MTTDQWIKMLRRKLADADTSSLRRQDGELLATAEDVRVELVARAVSSFEDVKIGLAKADAATYGIQDATPDQMVILMYSVAYEVLSATYRQRVDRGELGIVWRSGLEEESTVSAERAYRNILDDLQGRAEQLLVTHGRYVNNKRVI